MKGRDMCLYRQKRAYDVIVITEFLLGMMCFIYYFLCAKIYGTKVSILYLWLIAGNILVLKAMSVWLFWGKCGKVFKGLSRGFDICVGVVLLLILTFSVSVVSGMKEKAKPDCDYLIVLGAAVYGAQPSEVLQRRIDSAYEYLQNNPGTKVVGTGGRGAEGKLSEGECIAMELQKMGIAPDRILYEDKSATTVENMKYALEKIPDAPGSIAVVSSGFHIFRSKYILSCYTDAEVYGVAASGISLLTPHYVVREFVVFVVDGVMGNY